MEAGESAFDVARRQREKAARLERSASRWERGAAGEVEVARALGSLSAEWIVLHDLAWPGRPRASLDHVAIGPGGVFVVDAKNWSGRIEVRDQVLVQNGRRREQAVSSAAEAAIALQSIVPISHPCMGVLCFVRVEPLTGWARDVMVCSTSNVVEMLASRTEVLTPADVHRCVDAVRRSTGQRSQAPDRRTPSPVAGYVGTRRLRRSRGRPAAALVIGILIVGAVAGGGADRVSEWAGERFVSIFTPDTPPVPADQTDRLKPRKTKDKQDRQARG